MTRLGSAAVAATLLLLGACGGDDGVAEGESAALTVPMAACGAGDTAEPALQGQVPAAMRAAGFKGFNCNLSLVANARGEGASWQYAFAFDRTGRRCGYYGTSSPVNGTAHRNRLGTVVLDTTDAARPLATTTLTTASMLDPWESLKANQARRLLGAVNGTNAAGTAELDLYDLSEDCSSPQLLATVALGTTGNGDAAALPQGQALRGHEGEFSPDGLTWYGGDRGTPKKYTATDISDPRRPRLLATWELPASGDSRSVTTHGLSISDDGSRAYVSQAHIPAATDVGSALAPLNGIVILDVSDIQARHPNPQVRPLGTLTWKDGAQMQHTIPIRVKGRPYLVAVDEAGSAGNAFQTACKAGLPPFPFARIIDIGDERQPRLASRLMLQVHDPAHCDAVLPDTMGLLAFSYGSHYCSVDNRLDATTLACAYFNSGIRVFDIRVPERPREIAYFNPAGATTPSHGSNHYSPTAFPPSGSTAGNADICTAQIQLDAATRTLRTTCQDNGFLTLRFREGVWPFPESSTPPGLQN